MLGVECCGRMAALLLTETASSMTPLPRQWGWVGGWVDIAPPFTSFHLPSLSNPPAAGNEFSSLRLQTSLKSWSFGHVSILLSLMKLLVYLRTTDIRWPAESRWSTEAWNCLLWTPATFGWQEPREPQYDRQVCARLFLWHFLHEELEGVCFCFKGRTSLQMSETGEIHTRSPLTLSFLFKICHTLQQNMFHEICQLC